MRNLQMTANLIIKNLNGVVTFDSVEQCLHSKGYTVIYYSSPEGKTLLERYELTNYAQKLNAITYFNDSARFVFIDDRLSKQDMLCTLLHEAAHIYLGHLALNPFSKDKRRNEMEAEALAYAVLNYRKTHTLLIVAIAVLSTAIITSMFSSYYYNTKASTFEIEKTQASESETISTFIQSETEEIIEEQIIESDTETEIVYVTPYGTRYHRQNCKYLKNKQAMKLSLIDAENNYSPCSFCKP